MCLSCSVISNSFQTHGLANQAPLSLGILQARILEWAARTSSRALPNPEIEPRSSALQADSLLSEPQGKSNSSIRITISIIATKIREQKPLYLWALDFQQKCQGNSMWKGGFF